MKVLIVARSGNQTIFKPVVQNQFDSISSDISGIQFYVFPVVGTGILSYFKCIPNLFSILRNLKPDLIHAHYSFSGILASLTYMKSSIVVSLMGSDVEGGRLRKILIFFFAKFFWKRIIVKSESLKTKTGLSSAIIIPNGVDINKFRPLDQEQCKRKLLWKIDQKQILFMADPSRQEKNYELALRSFNILNSPNTELKVVFDIEPNMVPLYINAADVIILTSLWEGSPNIIKEAMACNRPIVATKVGDIEWLFGNEAGHYLSEFTPEDMDNKLEQAISYAKIFKNTIGRKRIESLGLDSISISKRIEKVYWDVIK